ncbi:MAG: dihydrodipicolinate synthase family protein [Proteobacteria bacterium]|nr:MAG: dihydrodipicolinate synthase family protein [Pseudomonadota bacterium]
MYPMLYAFFGPDGALDRSSITRQVQACMGGGAHGIAVLGLATEVGKLQEGERRALVQWVVSEVAGKLPVAVTVSGENADAQVAFARWATGEGASWVILQPPVARDRPESWLAEFFADVIDRIDIPCAIQNAPEYLGVGLTPEWIRWLKERCSNFTLLKGEGPVLTIREAIHAVDGRLSVFNGRGGLELTDNLRAGCAGMIPATDTFDYQVRIFERMRVGGDDNECEAEALYRRVLPAIVFTLQSLQTLICYGKRIAAFRLGLGPVHDRAPALVPTDFGIECARRYAAQLGPLP